jgi:hypothetical protein
MSAVGSPSHAISILEVRVKRDVIERRQDMQVVRRRDTPTGRRSFTARLCITRRPLSSPPVTILVRDITDGTGGGEARANRDYVRAAPLGKCVQIPARRDHHGWTDCEGRCVGR